MYQRVKIKLQTSEKIQDNKIAVLISPDLYQEIKKKIDGSGFSSVNDYVNYILHMSIGKKSEEEGEELSQEDTEAVTARLKALGYI